MEANTKARHKRSYIVTTCRANLKAFVFDDAFRQKLSKTNMTFGFFNPLPGLPLVSYAQPYQCDNNPKSEALTRAFPMPRHAVRYIMDTFPIVKRKDESKHGHYRTQQTILQIYDALTESMQSGVPYKTLLNPPPPDSACCHPPRSSQVP